MPVRDAEKMRLPVAFMLMFTGIWLVLLRFMVVMWSVHFPHPQRIIRHLSSEDEDEDEEKETH